MICGCSVVYCSFAVLGAVVSFSGRDPAQLVFACKIQATVSVCSHLASGGKDQKCNRYSLQNLCHE